MNPIILYNNKLLSGTLSVTSEATGYEKENLLDYRPYKLFKAGAGGTNYITIEFPGTTDANCYGFVGHNLHTAGAVIHFESYAGGVWTEDHEYTPASDKCFIKYFTNLQKEKYRFKIVTASIAPQIGVIFLGQYLQFPTTPVTPFIPITESIEAAEEISKSGHLLGVDIRYNPITTTAVFEDLLRTWVDSDYKPFWNNHAKLLKPFFFGWDLVTRASDCYYVRVPAEAVFEEPLSVLTYVDKIELKMRGINE